MYIHVRVGLRVLVRVKTSLILPANNQIFKGATCSDVGACVVWSLITGRSGLESALKIPLLFAFDSGSLALGLQESPSLACCRLIQLTEHTRATAPTH